MATYKTDRIELTYSAQQVYDKLSNPENLRGVLANIPADQLDAQKAEQLAQIQVTADSICLPAGPAGMLTLRITRREAPTLIMLQGEGSPVPVTLQINIEPLGDDLCAVEATFDLGIPAMLKPMVNGPLNKMMGQIGAMLRHIPFN